MNTTFAVLGLFFLCPSLLWTYRKGYRKANTKPNINYTGWKFLVTYARGNRDPWIIEFIDGIGLKSWIKRHREEYGFDVEILTTPQGMELRVDTHGLAGWEREVAQ